MERLVFVGSVESLFSQGLKGKVSPEVEATLRQAGIDLARLQPAYPSAVWRTALDKVAPVLFPTLTPGQALFRMGELTVLGLESTLIGRAMLSMAKLLGPRRALLRVPHNARTGSNYSDFHARDLGPEGVELEVRQLDSSPEFLQGVFHATVMATGGKDPKVEIVELDRPGERVRFRVGWS